MSRPLSFDEEKSKRVINDASKIKFSERQEKIFENIADLFTASFSELSPLVIKGLLRLSIKEWQTKHQASLVDVEHLPITRKREVFLELALIFKRRFARILRLYGEDVERLLDSKITEAISVYEKQFLK